MRRLVGLAIVGIAASLASSALGEETIRICIGQFDQLCPGEKKAWFPCGTSPEEAGRSVCTIHSGSGSGSVVRPFRILVLYTKPGNRCGYLGADITCLDAAPGQK
jgi:hypothetical protein